MHVIRARRSKHVVQEKEILRKNVVVCLNMVQLEQIYQNDYHISGYIHFKERKGVKICCFCHKKSVVFATKICCFCHKNMLCLSQKICCVCHNTVNLTLGCITFSSSVI